MIEYDDSELISLANRIGGLPVLACLPGASAIGAGVRRGDVIIEVNGRPISGVSDYIDARLLDTDLMLVVLVRDGRTLEVAIPMKSSALPTVNTRSVAGQS